jgi:chromosome segregation ATPase
VKSRDEINKAFEEANSRLEELEYLNRISNDLEGLHRTSVPAEIKQFRDEFGNFKKSLQQLRESLKSKEGKTDEELSKMY